MGKLDGKVGLVTGAGRGIGRAIALKLASEGASVVVNDLDAEPANAVVEEIKSVGGEAVTATGSVTDSGFAERFIGTAVDAFGGVDIIVNNAGYTWDNVIQKMTDEQWDTVLDLHLKAPFQILRAAQPVISAAVKKEAAEGRVVNRKVVNVSSVVGVRGNAGQANYSAAKGGLLAFTKTMAKEWGRYHVNVNCVAFGFVETRLMQPPTTIEVDGRELTVGVQQGAIDMLPVIVPLGRAATAEEAAGGVAMLTYPEADYVTGTLVHVDGGFGA